jgi:hypothetical protein
VEYELSDHAARRIFERKIEPRWIAATLSEPDRQEQDAIDPTASHAFRRIAEMDNRVLRVVYNTTTIPVRVISAFFERRMKGKL